MGISDNHPPNPFESSETDFPCSASIVRSKPNISVPMLSLSGDSPHLRHCYASFHTYLTRISIQIFMTVTRQKNIVTQHGSTLLNWHVRRRVSDRWSIYVSEWEYGKLYVNEQEYSGPDSRWAWVDINLRNVWRKRATGRGWGREIWLEYLFCQLLWLSNADECQECITPSAYTWETDWQQPWVNAPPDF